MLIYNEPCFFVFHRHAVSSILGRASQKVQRNDSSFLPYYIVVFKAGIFFVSNYFIMSSDPFVVYFTYYSIDVRKILMSVVCLFVIIEAKVLNTRAMHIAEDSEKKLLKRMFDYWVLEAHKVQKAKSHVNEKIMRR